MCPRPPTSTLFPYTTLFRSVFHAGTERDPEGGLRVHGGRVLTVTGLGDTVVEARSEEHTSELQSLRHLVCRLLLEKKKPNRRAEDTQTLSQLQHRHRYTPPE